jgi:hypothetical protein
MDAQFVSPPTREFRAFKRGFHARRIFGKGARLSPYGGSTEMPTNHFPSVIYAKTALERPN